jgi:exopolysaccharide production protein ExoF
MFGRRQPSKSSTGGQPAQQSAGSRDPKRTFRLSAIAATLLFSAPLVLGILIGLPPLRLAEGLRTLLSAPAHISAASRHSDLAQLPGPEMAKVQGTHLPLAAPAVSVGHEGNLLSYGDRLKITFYESLGVTLKASGGSSDQAIATIFPRMDLSAEYSVDEGGNLAVPKLGKLKIAGQPIAEAQLALAAAFEHVVGRSSDVNIAVVERQPIYVLGTVRNAGTFKHVPGMTVLQALANAGGIGSGATDTSRAIESIRETQRLRQMETRLDRLLTNQARLNALRDGSDSIAETTSKDGPATLVARAQAALAVERAGYQQQLSLAERLVEIARGERAAQNLRIAQINVLLAKKSDRLHDLEAIAARGSVPQFKLTDVGVDVAEVTARREDLRVALMQSERRLVEAEIALAKIQLEHSVGIDKELAMTQQEIDDTMQAIASMQAVTQVLHDGASGAVGRSASIPFLRITRRMAAGITVMQATEETALVPGDVVQVNFVDSFDPPDARAAQLITHSQN